MVKAFALLVFEIMLEVKCDNRDRNRGLSTVIYNYESD